MSVMTNAQPQEAVEDRFMPGVAVYSPAAVLAAVESVRRRAFLAHELEPLHVRKAPFA